MKSELSLTAALGAMRIIAEGGPSLTTELLNLTPENMALATGDRPWLATDRPVVRRTLDSFIYGVIDVLGLPRMDLPAEYTAAIIATFVAPCNYFPACSWIAGQVPNEELLVGKKGKPVEGFEKATPSELFALVLQLHSKGDETAASYAAKTGAVIDRLTFNSPELTTDEEVI